MTRPHIILEDKGDRLIVTNNNPSRRNALTEDFQAGFREALALAAARPRIAAVIVTGAEGFFCAGGDLNLLVKGASLPEEVRREKIGDLQDLVRDIVACPCPVIAAVEGGAAGAGASIALACDLIIASEDVAFSAAYVTAGLVPDGGLTAWVSALLPPPVAAHMCLTGKPVSAARMYQLGAINEVVPAGKTMEAAQKLADHFAAGPAKAQAAIKKLLTGARAAMVEGQLAAETEAMAAALGSDEATEGMTAFLTKRAPDFASLRGK